jgi:hypothetical protein
LKHQFGAKCFKIFEILNPLRLQENYDEITDQNCEFEGNPASVARLGSNPPAVISFKRGRTCSNPVPEPGA